ncbi:MAG: TetR/AcrR family transcriptional regulator [Ignavibacteria bacterium]
MEKQRLQEEKKKIIEFAQSKFFREGFYKTTVEEIAKDLMMSKNTIYKYFPNKEALVRETTHYLIKIIKTRIMGILSSRGNAIDKLVRIIDFMGRYVMRMDDKWLKDIHIHAPDLWEEIDRTRRILAYQNLAKLIEQGKKEKIIVDYPNEIILTVFVASMRSVINPGFLTNLRYTNREAVNFTFNIILNGILTKKGKNILNKLKLPT